MDDQNHDHSSDHEHDHGNGDENTEETREELHRLFSHLKNKVHVLLFTKKGKTTSIMTLPKRCSNGSDGSRIKS